MTNKDLFKEAIADAKQVREAALANAKVALEEALTPRLQSMLSTKLQEMEYEDEDMDENALSNIQEEDMEEDFDLSAILAELEAEEVEELEDESLFEVKEDDEADEAGEAGEDGEDDDSMKVDDLSIEQLKDIIKDIVSQELENEEEVESSEENGEEDEMDMGGEDEIISDDDEEINLEELLAELDALDKTKEVEESNDKEELKEAIKIIKTLRNELQEVNLLNAKLLYVNKIFKSKNLTESQKVKVIASFDKATTAKEAKIVFESLEGTLTATFSNKSQIKESLGFASKAAGVAPVKKQIFEVNDSVSRMQQLAGINK